MKELKNGRSRLVDCNGAELHNIILSRGFAPRDIAEVLGYSREYFNKVFRTNKIGVTCVKLLEERFGIDSSTYMDSCSRLEPKTASIKDKIIRKRDKDRVAVQPIVLKAEIDPQQLKSLIKQAVLEAFEEL